MRKYAIFKKDAPRRIFFYHLIPVPVLSSDSSGFLSSLLGILLWTVPFAAAYFWHLYHDHKHNHKMDKKMDEIVELLKKIARGK